MTCKTCGDRRTVTYAADTCQPERQGPCPSCVGVTVATAPAVAIGAGEVERIRNEAIRDAAAIAMTHAIKAGGAEGRARRAAAADGSISGQQVEIEEAVGFSKIGRSAHTMAKQILSYIPGAVSDPNLPTIDSVADLVPVHAAEWLAHLRSDEPLMRHTTADNLERVIRALVVAQDQSGTALVNLNYYIIDLQTVVKDLMTALSNAYHPAYEQGRKVLTKGGK